MVYTIPDRSNGDLFTENEYNAIEALEKELKDAGSDIWVSSMNLLNHDGRLDVLEALNVGAHISDTTIHFIKSSILLADLGDVDSATPTDGQVLTFDTVNGWQPEDVPPGITDHSLLSNLTWSTAGHTINTTVDMANNPLINIGAAGTDFSGTGGLTLADSLSVYEAVDKHVLVNSTPTLTQILAEQGGAQFDVTLQSGTPQFFFSQDSAISPGTNFLVRLQGNSPFVKLNSKNSYLEYYSDGTPASEWAGLTMVEGGGGQVVWLWVDSSRAYLEGSTSIPFDFKSYSQLNFIPNGINTRASISNTSVDILVPLNMSDDINMDTNDISEISSLNFDTTISHPAGVKGRTYFNSTEGLIQMDLRTGDPHPHAELGFNVLVRGINKQGTGINQGDVVFVSGGTSEIVEVKLAQANTHAEAINTIGMCMEDASVDAELYICMNGHVRGFDTTIDSDGNPANDGDVVYLSALNDGGWTVVPPVAPNHRVKLGYITSDATLGSILLVPFIGAELNELHDVNEATPTDGQLLTWDNSNQYWKPANLDIGGEDHSTLSNLTWSTAGHTINTSLDMVNNTILNIGAAGTDFTGTGGLTLADILTVTSGGASITGDLDMNGSDITYLDTITDITDANRISVFSTSPNIKFFGDGGASYTPSFSLESVSYPGYRSAFFTDADESWMFVEAGSQAKGVWFGGSIDDYQARGYDGLGDFSISLFTNIHLSPDGTNSRFSLTDTAADILVPLDMNDSVITNIGATGTSFTATGGLSIVDFLHLTPGTAPVTPVEGDVYSNDIDNTIYYYNGTAWKDMTAFNGDHSVLSNLNWASAGHTIDADIDMVLSGVINADRVTGGAVDAQHLIIAGGSVGTANNDIIFQTSNNTVQTERMRINNGPGPEIDVFVPINLNNGNLIGISTLRGVGDNFTMYGTTAEFVVDVSGNDAIFRALAPLGDVYLASGAINKIYIGDSIYVNNSSTFLDMASGLIQNCGTINGQTISASTIHGAFTDNDHPQYFYLGGTSALTADVVKLTKGGEDVYNFETDASSNWSILKIQPETPSNGIVTIQAGEGVGNPVYAQIKGDAAYLEIDGDTNDPFLRLSSVSGGSFDNIGISAGTNIAEWTLRHTTDTTRYVEYRAGSGVGANGYFQIEDSGTGKYARLGYGTMHLYDGTQSFNMSIDSVGSDITLEGATGYEFIFDKASEYIFKPDGTNQRIGISDTLFTLGVPISGIATFKPDGTNTRFTVADTEVDSLVNIDLNNNVINNIGAAGTDFTGTGGLNLADDLVLGAGVNTKIQNLGVYGCTNTTDEIYFFASNDGLATFGGGIQCFGYQHATDAGHIMLSSGQNVGSVVNVYSEDGTGSSTKPIARFSGGSGSTGQFDMLNHPIVNIGASGTDFTATGGLTLADALTVALAADPGSPLEGTLWYNSTDDKLKYYDGTTTQIVTKQVDVEPSYGNLYDYNTPTSTSMALAVADTFYTVDIFQVGETAGAGYVVGTAGAGGNLTVGASGAGVYKVDYGLNVLTNPESEITVAVFDEAVQRNELSSVFRSNKVNTRFPNDISIIDPTSFTLPTPLGSIVSGTLQDLRVDDSIYVQIAEVTENPGILAEVKFPNLIDPGVLQFYGAFNGSATHDIEVLALDEDKTVSLVTNGGQDYVCYYSHSSTGTGGVDEPGAGTKWKRYWEETNGGPFTAWDNVGGTNYTGDFVDMKAGEGDIPHTGDPTGDPTVEVHRTWEFPSTGTFVDASGVCTIRLQHSDDGGAATHDLYIDSISIFDKISRANVSGSSLITLSANDTLDLRVASDTTSDTIYIQSTNLTIHRVST